MMTPNRSAAFGAAAVVAVVVGIAVIASLPVMAGLLIASATSAGLAYVAFAAQARRFEDDSRRVYRPVYVRSRNVHRRVSSLDD